MVSGIPRDCQMLTSSLRSPKRTESRPTLPPPIDPGEAASLKDERLRRLHALAGLERGRKGGHPAWSVSKL